MDDAFYERLAGQRRDSDVAASLTEEWFPEERKFFDDDSQLAAACCGRRAGKTRGLVRDLARDALTTPGGRYLYLNSTRGEAERLAWWGSRNDGIASLVTAKKLNVKLDQGKLSAHFLDTDAWVYLRGADDEAELRKALGGLYHKVYWDEAQKIPPKLELSIREVFMPALLDFGGKLRLTGSPSRQMVGLFYSVTRPEFSRRLAGWRSFHWNLLANPFFGADRDARYERGVLGLQKLYGGPEAAPIDSPIMQREAFGRWVREDSNFVYAVNKVASDRLTYAPHRVRKDGFVDVPTALKDLPFKPKDGMFAMGTDLGYNDPFTVVLWAWHANDPALYEVCSWRKPELDSDAQVSVLRAIREHVAIGIIDADAGGIGKQVVKGWSREWVERYGLPIFEAEKQHKLTAIQTMNTDILRGGVKFRDGGPLLDEMRELQWSTIVDGSGRMVEDPTMANDVCDAALYSHRRSFQFRWKPAETKLQTGTVAHALREAKEIEDDMASMNDGTWH